MANDLVNFIPEVWSKKLQKNFDDNTVLKPLVNKNYEGEIKAAGDTVHIRGFDDITIGDYTKYSELTPQDLTDPMDDLLIDQQKYFAFNVDDIDKAQADISILDGYTKRAAVAMAQTVDKAIHAQYANVHANNVTGTSGAPITLTKDNVYEYLVDMKTQMDKGNAPRGARHLVVNPAVEGLLVKSDQFTHATGMGDDVVKNGYIGKVAGFKVHCSTNLNTVTGNTPLLALTSDLITFAMQITKTEAVRPSKQFVTLVKGLNVYGMKVPSKHNKQGAVLWVSNA